MSEIETMDTMPEKGMTDEEIAALEAERAAKEAAKIAPYQAAREQREASASVVAEHDQLLADMLYEMTMNEFGEEE